MRVLVCDDVAELRELLKIYLELEQDMQVIGEAANGKEAVHLANELKPDLIIMDLAMPIMDGLQAIISIRGTDSHVKIVALSGFKEERMHKKAAASGADMYLEKGTSMEKIVAALKSLG